MRAVRTLALPTLVYLGVTLVAPALNGASAHRRFWVHAAWVASACAVVLLACAVASWLADRAHGRKRA